MRKGHYKQVDTQVIKQTIHHEESVDENGNVIPPYDEVIDKVIPIMGTVYEESDDVIEVPQQHHEEPSQLDVIQAQVLFTALMTDTLLEV